MNITSTHGSLEPDHASNLTTRIVTASVGLPLTLALLILGPPQLVFVIFVILAARTTFELERLIKTRAAPIAISLATLTFAAAASVSPTSTTRVLAAGFLTAMLTGAALRGSINDRAERSRTILFTVAYPTLTWLAVWKIYSASISLLLLAFVISWGSDTAAYFGGKRWGSRPMSPNISPKKTWEGAACGFVGSIVASIAFSLWRTPLGDTKTAAVIIPFAAIAAQLGDLFKSVLKRNAGVKDAGGILPGHGGLLDRLDSTLLVAATLWLAGVAA